LAVAALALRVAVGVMFRATFQFNAELGVLSSRILETYNGIGVLQSYGALGQALARFDATNSSLERLGTDLARVRALLLPVVNVTGNLCVVIVLMLGGARVQSGELTLGQLAAFTVYVNLLVSGMTGFGWLVNAVQRGWLSLGRMYEVIDAPTDRPEPDATLPAARDTGCALSIRNLTFAYAAAPDRPAEAGVEDYAAISAESIEGELSRVVDGVMSGHPDRAASELAKLAHSGLSGIPVLRALFKRTVLLAALRKDVDAGRTPADVVEARGKAIFWKEKPAITDQTGRWTSDRLAILADRILKTERALKSSGSAGELLADAELITIARAATRRR
jgi:ABC-type multidrug transport system fused ATPase/permease subunit